MLASSFGHIPHHWSKKFGYLFCRPVRAKALASRPTRDMHWHVASSYFEGQNARSGTRTHTVYSTRGF